MTTADPLVAEYLPIIRARVMKKYWWVDGKGNCLLTVDDLMQVAAIKLVRLAARWDSFLASEGKTREGNNPLFWKFLEHEVKQDIHRYFERVARTDRAPADSFDDIGENAENTDAEFRTALRVSGDGELGALVRADIVEYFEVMPRVDKVRLALRYFDELPHEEIADLMGVPLKSHQNLTAIIQQNWRVHARNQWAEHPTPAPRRRPPAWEPPEQLVEYLRMRHRKDIHEWLGYVTICFKADVGYLVSILGPTRHLVPDDEGRLLRRPSAASVGDVA